MNHQLRWDLFHAQREAKEALEDGLQGEADLSELVGMGVQALA
jgi:hypothetical protein